jgi:hypothetical protein
MIYSSYTFLLQYVFFHYTPTFCLLIKMETSKFYENYVTYFWAWMVVNHVSTIYWMIFIGWLFRQDSLPCAMKHLSIFCIHQIQTKTCIWTQTLKTCILYNLITYSTDIGNTWELSVKYSKESTKTLCLLKTGNKVVKVGWVHSKVEDNNSMRRGPQWEANWVPILNG